MDRRRFEHLVVEMSLALGLQVPRYPLWLFLHERGFDPEQLSAVGVLAFCNGPLTGFLADRGLALRPRQLRRLRRAVRRFDPAVPTPCERLAHLG